MVFDVLKLIDDLNGQSTIYRQTLGENINAGTFSGLAMLSSSGKLPLVDSTRALEQAFSEIFDVILYRIKEGGIDHPVLKAADIPENYELKVTFKPDLPQDELRNSQIATQLKGLVSSEWIQSNTLVLKIVTPCVSRYSRSRYTRRCLPVLPAQSHPIFSSW